MTCADAAALIPLYLTGELDSGELSGSRTREFAEHTQSCVECAREVSRQMALDARLRAAVLAEPVDSSAIESRVMARIEAGNASQTKAWRWSAAAAAIAAVLVLGLTIGYTGYRAMVPPKATGVFAAAARDHRMEIVDRQPRRWRTDLASVNDLAAREGISTGIVSKIAPAGYRFQQAKLCKLDGVLYLHLVYSDSSGAKNFSVFLDGQDQHHVEEIYASRLGAEHVAGFETDRLRAVIVTDQSGDAALTFARFAASVI